MIDVRRYNKLKEKCSKYSSWAIWKDAGEKPKSNTDDLSVFDDDLNICEKLNDKYVFVGLNVSRTPENEPWRNFHSGDSHQNDFKLRYALKDTKFWGSYITDIIKDYPKKEGSDVQKYLKNNPQVVKDNIQTFKKELNLLSDKKPILIAMGDASHKILQNNLADEYGRIYHITHYSSYISKEKYRERVLSQLEDVE